MRDTLVLDIPDEAGNFDSVLVRRAARQLRDSTNRWADYARSQGLIETVQPLLVLQTPNTPDPNDVGVALTPGLHLRSQPAGHLAEASPPYHASLGLGAGQANSASVH